jgi:hypothetical protein
MATRSAKTFKGRNTLGRDTGSDPDMEAATSNQSSVDSLRQLLRDASAMQANQYFGDPSVSMIDHPSEHSLGQVLTRYIAIVMLTSDELRIVFKVHFNPDPIRSFRRTRHCTESDLSDKQLTDFMKELSNQIGGRICRIFDAHHLSMGMSIPLCTRGIYEIYADYQPKSGTVTKFGDFWRLEGAFKSIYCSCYVELMSKMDLSDIKYSDEHAQEGELDFL